MNIFLLITGHIAITTNMNGHLLDSLILYEHFSITDKPHNYQYYWTLFRAAGRVT